MSLSLNGAGYTYGAGTSFAVRALHEVDLEVSVGELVLVLGSTGSGKSTLLRLAAGLMDPAEGSAMLDGVPLGRRNARGVVGLVFQDAESQLFADTVLDDVAFGPRNLGATKAEAEAVAREALERVGLSPDEFGSRSPFALSGGEARRAAIAGVLAMGPRYLMADEPTAGLDARGRGILRQVVLSMRDSAGVVVVSHSAEEFLGEADRVIVLSGGRVAWSGDAESLVQDPEHLASAGLRAPDVLEVQRLARRRGLDLPELSLDPVRAAASLSAGRVKG